MFKVLSLTSGNHCLLFNEQETFIVNYVSNQVTKLMSDLNISKLVTIGNSFSWVSNNISRLTNIDVVYYAYSKSTFTDDFSMGKKISAVFDLDLYRKNILSNSVTNLRMMFLNNNMNVDSILSIPRLYLDMTKTGSGLRSFIHELELFIYDNDPENIINNLNLFKTYNSIMVFQPERYKKNEIKQGLFKGYNLFFVSVSTNDECLLEKFCDDDECRFVPSNPIDGDFRFYNKIIFS